jgi:imidazolonepropionase
MTENLALMMTIACVRLGMRPEEALCATTLNAARALGRERVVGSLAVGKQADAVIWAASSFEHLIYHFGVDHAMTVFKKGKVACSNEAPRCFVH